MASSHCCVSPDEDRHVQSAFEWAHVNSQQASDDKARPISPIITLVSLVVQDDVAEESENV